MFTAENPVELREPAAPVIRMGRRLNDDFESLAHERLRWLPELGLGFLDVETDGLYGDAYFEHYQTLERTERAGLLTSARCLMVGRHWPGAVTDIGIGSGMFITCHGNANGWDINPVAIKWLYARGLLVDPRSCPVQAATFWDSLEHMRNPSEILDNVLRWAFIATPIYSNWFDAQASKHYKPGEHLWYFTEWGLVEFMRLHGFALREVNRRECDLGREAIGSYAFERGVTP